MFYFPKALVRLCGAIVASTNLFPGMFLHPGLILSMEYHWKGVPVGEQKKTNVQMMLLDLVW